MASEQTFKIQTDEDRDPFVLAYRIGEGRNDSKILRVRRSELLKDPKLFEISKSSRSIGFDHEKSLQTRSKKMRPADPHVRNKIEYELMLKENKRRIREEKLESLPENINQITSINDMAAQQILAIVTNQLIKEGLWIDEYKDLTMSEAFPLSQTQADSRMKVPNGAFENGTFLSESDLTHEDLAACDAPSSLMKQLTPFRKPSLSSPMIYNLMRASPKDLEHQIARRMIDTHYFEDHPEDENLYPASFFSSRAVEKEEHFDLLMKAGLEKEFPHYTFKTFQVDRIKLKKRIRALIDGFFLENPAVKERLSLRTEPEKRDPKSVWKRFYKVWDSLTEKQIEVLELVYINEPKLTKKKTAEKLGITIDSVKDRLKIAIRQFRKEFSELEGISPKRSPRKLLKGFLTHNGLWRYQSAIWKSKLYRVGFKGSSISDTKFEIEWKIKPRSKNLDWKTIARIKAEIIENCPVPHFHETEYFDGMKPTIASFGRRPGNF